MFLIGVLALLFVMGYVTRRRFGVLGLALAAGSLLSANFAGTLVPFIEQQGFVLVAPPLSVVVQVALIIAPPLVLLFSGPTYQKTWPRVGGALCFALLGMAFLVAPLKTVMALDGPGQSLFSLFEQYANLIIVLGMVLAVIDVLFTGRGKSKKHDH